MVMLACATRALALQELDPSRKVTQYRLQLWTDENGLPQNSVNSVLQLRDGTILAGTQEGLAVYDGVTLAPPTWGPLSTLGTIWVNRLLEDADGTLWLASRGRGLVRVRNGSVTTFGAGERLRGESIESIYRDRAGRLWIGTSDAGLYRLDGERAVPVPLGGASGSEFIHAISSDARGDLLVGTRGGLFVGRPGRWDRYGARDGLVSDHVYALTPGARDTVWIGTASGGLAVLSGRRVSSVRGWTPSSGSVFAIRRDSRGSLWLATNGGGLIRFYRGRTDALTTSNGFPSNLVWSLGADHEGGLWAGTNGGGLVRIDDPPVTVFGTPEGLSSDIALATLQGRDGTLWVGTAGGGLNAIQGGVVRHYTTADGLATNIVTALHEDQSGSLWIGTGPHGLHVMRGGRIARVNMGDAFPGAGTNAIHVDARGRLWVGSNGAGLGVRYENRWRFFRSPEALPSNFVQAMATDSSGILYIATRAGVLAVHGDRLVRQPVFADAAKNRIVAMYASRSGSLWLATFTPGLARLRGGRLVHIGPDRGLPERNVNGIVEDSTGTLWLTTNGGIFAVSARELDRVADGTLARVSGFSIGKPEGMRSRETNGGVDPPGAVGTLGGIWIPTMRGVVRLDPERIAMGRTPAVSVTGVLLGDFPIPTSAASALPSGTHRMRIAYRVLSFAPQEALTVQYRLAGVDPDWVDAGVSRVADYTGLSTRAHSFQVRARHRNGEWSASTPVVVRRLPRWWERPAVHLLALLLVAGLLLSAHRIRLRYWKSEAGRHESSAAEKEVVLAAVRALLEHASDAIFVLDSKRRISYASPSMERLTGRASSALLGKPLADVCHPDDREGVTQALDSIMAQPRTPTSFRYRVAVADGEWRTFAAIGQNLLDELSVNGVIVNARDVTEQEETENLFRQTQKMEAVGKLAGGIAHDFNNLLAVITASASMVKEDLADMNVSVDGLDEIEQAAAGGERLTRQLLSFSKNKVSHPEIVDLRAVVEETVPMLRPLVGSGVTITVEALEPALVNVDRGEIEQVIVNLVVNAKGAMPRTGTVTLSVQGTNHAVPDATIAGDAGSYVVLSVADTGSGMSEETRRQVFNPFFTTKDSGTGLGLATVSRIAKKAHGFVTVESEVGKGSTFHVHLPRVATSAPATGIPGARLAGMTVLVVDDDDAIRGPAARILRGAGAEVLVADSGEAALDLLGAHAGRIDLLLTDLVMPGMSGRELSNRFLASRPVSVLYMSGYTGGEIARSRAEGRDVGFLAKPFDAETLLDAVERAVANPAASVGI